MVVGVQRRPISPPFWVQSPQLQLELPHGRLHRLYRLCLHPSRQAPWAPGGAEAAVHPPVLLLGVRVQVQVLGVAVAVLVLISLREVSST